MKTPREVVQDWVAAYNQRVASAAAELYHEDATNLQVALGNPTIGRQAMLDDLLSFFHAFPDNFTHPENLLEDGEWAMLECSEAAPGGTSSAGWPPTADRTRWGVVLAAGLLVLGVGLIRGRRATPREG